MSFSPASSRKYTLTPPLLLTTNNIDGGGIDANNNNPTFTSSSLSNCLIRISSLTNNGKLELEEKNLLKALLLGTKIPDERVMACFLASPTTQDDDELVHSLRTLLTPIKNSLITTNTTTNISPRTTTSTTNNNTPPSAATSISSLTNKVPITPVLGASTSSTTTPPFNLSSSIAAAAATTITSTSSSIINNHSFLRPHHSAGGGRMTKTVLFAAKEMSDLASQAIALYPAQFYPGKIIWERFDEPEGWPNVFIERARELPLCDAMFLASFHSPQVVFEQLSVIYALARYGLRKLLVVVPFFATGTMERIERVGEVATAASLARILSMIPQCAGGPTQLLILDIHALQERFYFTDNVIVHLKSCVRLLNEEIAKLPKEEPVCIVFPDDGAWKRFHTKFEDRHITVCHKIRDGSSRVVKIRDGLEHVNGAHCIIVDDLVKSGGTLIECGLLLKAAGAKKISAYVTHGVFPADSWKKFVIGDVANQKIDFYRFWITDSIPTIAKQVQDKEPFRVLSIVPVLSLIQSWGIEGAWDG
jgi:phosphoribosylpyrophosphate synthetase